MRKMGGVRIAMVVSLIPSAFAYRQEASGEEAAGPVQTSGPASAAPPLGSPGFQPSRTRPVGWRGDWTGRFPGANPPMEWSRRIKGSTTEIRYPAGEPGAGSFPLEHFTIKERLVAGPNPGGIRKGARLVQGQDQARLDPASRRIRHHQHAPGCDVRSPGFDLERRAAGQRGEAGLAGRERPRRWFVRRGVCS